MKTRFDVILETVSHILEANKPKKSRIARIAAIRERDPERGDALMAKLDASDKNAVRDYSRASRDPERDAPEKD